MEIMDDVDKQFQQNGEDERLIGEGQRKKKRINIRDNEYGKIFQAVLFYINWKGGSGVTPRQEMWGDGISCTMEGLASDSALAVHLQQQEGGGIWLQSLAGAQVQKWWYVCQSAQAAVINTIDWGA